MLKIIALSTLMALAGTAASAAETKPSPYAG